MAKEKPVLIHARHVTKVNRIGRPLEKNFTPLLWERVKNSGNWIPTGEKTEAPAPLKTND